MPFGVREPVFAVIVVVSVQPWSVRTRLILDAPFTHQEPQQLLAMRDQLNPELMCIQIRHMPFISHVLCVADLQLLVRYSQPIVHGFVPPNVIVPLGESDYLTVFGNCVAHIVHAGVRQHQSHVADRHGSNCPVTMRMLVMIWSRLDWLYQILLTQVPLIRFWINKNCWNWRTALQMLLRLACYSTDDCFLLRKRKTFRDFLSSPQNRLVHDKYSRTKWFHFASCSILVVFE